MGVATSTMSSFPVTTNLFPEYSVAQAESLQILYYEAKQSLPE